MLDSGADTSALPLRFSKVGESTWTNVGTFVGAQGGSFGDPRCEDSFGGSWHRQVEGTIRYCGCDYTTPISWTPSCRTVTTTPER